MIKRFLNECVNDAKEEYFKNDHHYYAGENGKDEDWKNVYSWDIFIEYVLPIISDRCKDLYELSMPENLYVFCKKIVIGE